MRLTHTEHLEQLIKDLVSQDRRLCRAVREAEKVYGRLSDSAATLRRRRAGYRSAVAIVREELAELRARVTP